jgi:hypothetical protein
MRTFWEEEDLADRVMVHSSDERGSNGENWEECSMTETSGK